MMQVSKSVLSGLLILGVLWVCLAQAQERQFLPGFMSHALYYYEPNEDCEQVTIQFAIAKGTVRVAFTDVKDLKDKMSFTHVDANVTYVVGGANCQIRLALSRP
jgi:hypothetical protein